jgi:hypothetical protein
MPSACTHLMHLGWWISFQFLGKLEGHMNYYKERWDPDWVWVGTAFRDPLSSVVMVFAIAHLAVWYIFRTKISHNNLSVQYGMGMDGDVTRILLLDYANVRRYRRAPSVNSSAGEMSRKISNVENKNVHPPLTVTCSKSSSNLPVTVTVSIVLRTYFPSQ